MNKLTKFFATILILFTLAPSVAAYDDIPGDSPYFYAIEYLRKNDVFQDTKVFKPDSDVSRAEFIVYLVKLNARKENIKRPTSLPFSDTRLNAWYAPYVAEAINLGILTGNEGKLNPDRRITLLEALELLYHSRSIPIPRRYVGEMPFKDLARNKGAQALVMRSMELGIVMPQKRDNFGLYRRMTKAEAARMIYKMDLVDLRESQGPVATGSDANLEKIDSAYRLILSSYVDKEGLDTKKMTDATVRAMADALGDPYSTYLDVEENGSMSDELGGQFEGIGAYVEMKEDKSIAIVAPIKDSPAAKAGIHAGDIIRKVDDFDTAGATLQETVRRIKGKSGTSVKLTLQRNGETMVIEVVRGVVKINAVEYEVIGGGKVMHIRLISFNINAIKEFGEVVELILANPDIKGIVLDVRDDPGGLLEAALGILNYLLPTNSSSVTVVYSFFSYTQYTSGVGELSKYPMVVLVNKGSASASEIVAGALKDHERAKIIGETTFGKGTVQEINYFADGSSLKLTVAKWLTPLGHSIQKNGITPDIAVSSATENSDPPLERALQELSGLMR